MFSSDPVTKVYFMKTSTFIVSFLNKNDHLILAPGAHPATGLTVTVGATATLRETSEVKLTVTVTCQLRTSKNVFTFESKY